MKPRPSIVAHVDVPLVCRKNLRSASTWKRPSHIDEETNVKVSRPVILLLSCVLLFTGCSFSQVFSFGTALAVFRNSKEIAIAADSRSMTEDGEIRDDNSCKIARVGNLVITADGMAEWAGSEPNSVFKIAAELARRGALTISNTGEFEETIVDAIRKSRGTLSIAKTGQALGVVIAGNIEGIPYVRSINFMKTEEGCFFPYPTDFPGSTCGTRCIAVIKAPATEKATFTKFSDPVTVARGFVQREINKGTKTIGGKLELVVLTAKDIEWREDPLDCKSKKY